MKVYVIIPARYGSTRLPAKALADIAGKPMIQHVYERVHRLSSLDHVVVATDDDRISDKVIAFGGKALRTSPRHLSGTDRVAGAARLMQADSEDLIINIQGDQPIFETRIIEQLIQPFQEDPSLLMGTLARPIDLPEELANPNIVKVVMDINHYALYFSRSIIPYSRSSPRPLNYYKHIGIYAYRMSFLQKFTKLERGRLEDAESLEQLRALEHGYRILVVESRFDSIGVDTPEDLEKVREILVENERLGDSAEMIFNRAL